MAKLKLLSYSELACSRVGRQASRMGSSGLVLGLVLAPARESLYGAFSFGRLGCGRITFPVGL